jgi:hypothetical protein
MNKLKLSGILLFCLCTTPAAPGRAANEGVPPLPDWQVLEFEEKAYWATAKSRLEILPDPDDESLWELSVHSSVVGNSEQIEVNFEPTFGRVHTRSRFSRGKGQRLKSYQYESNFVLRERRNPGTDPDVAAEDWPITSRREVTVPASDTNTVVTTSYLLLLLAQRLQALGPEKSQTLLVHTDLNFYRVQLTSGKGIPITVDYEVDGQGNVSGERETNAVALQFSPAGTPEDDNDFDLLGLQEDIILFFDRNSGLPLQIRGVAPRIGATKIKLKSVTMRESKP